MKTFKKIKLLLSDTVEFDRNIMGTLFDLVNGQAMTNRKRIKCRKGEPAYVLENIREIWEGMRDTI